MALLKAIAIALLLLLIAAVAGWFEGNNYIGWGLAVTIVTLLLYIMFRR